MKEIQIKYNIKIMVDDSDFDWLSKYKWSLNGSGYAAANVNGKTELMHRLIMGAKYGQEIDHKDRNKKNYQRNNLRFCTRSQNNDNIGISSRNKTGFKGVCWQNRERKYQSRIYVNGRSIHLGFFDDALDAAQKYNEAVKKYRGEYSYLNTIPTEAIC
jgi:hypothetical protein